MAENKKAFGDFLRKAIKQVGISQSAFYLEVNITKPYFYDILSGKVNPPPPDMQYKMLAVLKLEGQERNEFLNLAAEGRGEVPADIALLIMNNLDNIDRMRAALTEAISSTISEV